MLYFGPSWNVLYGVTSHSQIFCPNRKFNGRIRWFNPKFNSMNPLPLAIDQLLNYTGNNKNTACFDSVHTIFIVHNIIFFLKKWPQWHNKMRLTHSSAVYKLYWLQFNSNYRPPMHRLWPTNQSTMSWCHLYLYTPLTIVSEAHRMLPITSD